MRKRRAIDVLLAQYPYLQREKGIAFFFCGEVTIDGERVKDPFALVRVGAKVELTPTRYVSRGGLKLEYALREWQIPLEGKGMLDAGSSTGGFTDCLLQFGAKFVHAVDVGFNQIHPKFRVDARVFLHEGTN
ncbi:MAG: SAM-dependent methyltransferase, partial [Spirochaetales bacterium]